MAIRVSKPKFEIADNHGNWERVKKAEVTPKGWLHYELPDGTIGLKAPKTWREVLDVNF
jgi:hypothetical protein